MIIGMLPMATGLGEGGSQNAPLGRAVSGGLLVATVGDTIIRTCDLLASEEGKKIPTLLNQLWQPQVARMSDKTITPETDQTGKGISSGRTKAARQNNRAAHRNSSRCLFRVFW